MSKSLVVVESPAKAKTINQYLGKDFIVKSSIGHVRDLPKTGKSYSGNKTDALSTKGMTIEEKTRIKKENKQNTLIKKIGINPFHGWTANYQILPGKEKIVSELKELAKNVDNIYLATDLDREGEAIAWHLQEIIGGDKGRYKRVVFNEITKNSIQQAFKQPIDLNMNGVNAQQARRFMDRIVGFMVSPLLWKKIARGLSAGRVQSVAVKILVEREQKIKTFIPEEFWDIYVNTLTKNNNCLCLQVIKKNNLTLKVANKAETKLITKILKNAEYEVCNREDKSTLKKAPAPYITSTLQQAASTILGYSVKRTMILSQKLYEAGYITYMRTDSTNLSVESIESARKYIVNEFGKSYLPIKSNIYNNKPGAQEAHEAIRPSDITVQAQKLKNMDQDACKLYTLIWNQFISCQMTEAQYHLTKIYVKAEKYILQSKGRILKFDGWTRVQRPFGKQNEEKLLPTVQIGDKLKFNHIKTKQRFTKPPTRFTEASLVKELEKKGIGRPSTYSAIISTIQERGYVKLEQRRFYSEKMGEIVTDRLNTSFVDLMNYNFTARMEKQLDQIAEGNANWKTILDSFFNDFTHDLQRAGKDIKYGGMKPNYIVETNIPCPTCTRPMVVRIASTGVFLSCSGYELLPKDRCKTTINLSKENWNNNILSEESETAALRAKKRCQNCKMAMDAYFIDDKHKIHLCGSNSSCTGYIIEIGQFKGQGYSGPLIKCDKCNADMLLKNGRFGKYMDCTSSDCKNTRKILKNGEVAPPKLEPIHFPELPCKDSNAYFILRDGASGLFMAASNFPKSRETRAPLVKELINFKERLHSKLLYLTLAPSEDPSGLSTVIRFSRKSKETYVRSELNGKPSGWSSFYIEGKWEIMDTRKKTLNRSK
ncbi:DNA topoisomerase 1 [Candidatus Photodesmus katoptron]|uniref:type I DNA topoisomerase n=1 Tax=Candidatus Photodesmus anomalopis TaxID=28176 RepID=UPI0004D9323A|nr:type I DNA topoisomerase [Candidatus Photodesmus katoptron]KEY90824.1 DNA topoisomerase 1 [Candidatus Photodesmus katoptron]